jgi:hypothetical protein
MSDLCLELQIFPLGSTRLKILVLLQNPLGLLLTLTTLPYLPTLLDAEVKRKVPLSMLEGLLVVV